jgi:hypothetical protein
MPRRTKSQVETFTLAAAIESIERSYFIGEHREHRRVDDEAILTISGVIERISKRHKRHAGGAIEMQFVCARSFDREKPLPAIDQPFLLSVSFRGENRSLMAYLPSDAFWALPEMITSQAVTHVEAEFGPSHSGHADLQWLNFTRAPTFAEQD